MLRGLVLGRRTVVPSLPGSALPLLRAHGPEQGARGGVRPAAPAGRRARGRGAGAVARPPEPDPYQQNRRATGHPGERRPTHYLGPYPDQAAQRAEGRYPAKRRGRGTTLGSRADAPAAGASARLPVACHICLETATALKRGIRVIPGLARLAYSRRSANQVRDRGFQRGAREAVLSRTIESGNDGEGSLTVSDERLGGMDRRPEVRLEEAAIIKRIQVRSAVALCRSLAKSNPRSILP